MQLRRLGLLACLMVCSIYGCAKEATKAPAPAMTAAPGNVPPALPETVVKPDAMEAVANDSTEAKAVDLPATAGSKSVPMDSKAATAETKTSTPATTEATPDEPQPAPKAAPKLSRKELLKKASTGVVLISLYDALGEKAGFGSGCLIAPGLVLTNYHVANAAVTAKVQPRGEGDERVGAAVSVEGYRLLDEENDLAVLEVKGLPESLQILSVAEPDSVDQFDEVFAIGHPDGLKFTTSPGFVNGVFKASDLPEQFQAAIRNKATELIQTDAVIAGGSSGGPLLNEKAEIVGINTFRLTNRVGLAVAVKHIRALLNKLPEQTETHALPLPNSPVLVTRAVAQLQRDYVREVQQFLGDVQAAAKNPTEMQKLMRRNNPGPSFLQLCRDVAKEHPGQKEVVDALRLSTNILRSTRATAGRQYLDELLRDGLANPDLIPPTVRAVKALHGLPYSQDMENFLRHVIETSDDMTARGAAGIVLITAMSQSTSPAMPDESAELAREVYDNYGNEQFDSKTIKEGLQPIIDNMQFSVGSEAPDIEGTDESGQQFHLSDYRGKVVVLDFWADWCPHCRNLYPHERELVERMKDKPFALVGVNGDETDRAKRVISAGTVTWKSFLDGPTGPIAKQYRIQAWPTIFVLDKEGRIQYEGLRGEQLDEAINLLIGESRADTTNDVISWGALWKYKFADAADDAANWKTVDLDDANWQSGSGAFGFGRVSAATKIDFGKSGERQLAIQFRKTFNKPETELPPKLLMQLKYVDGVAVYLNGEEIYRDHLTKDCDAKSPAASYATNREKRMVSVLVDANRLQAGKNELAVEAHLKSRYRAEGLFDLSLGSLPDLTKFPDDLSDTKKIEICDLLADVGVDLPGGRELLNKWQTGESKTVCMEAAITSAMYDLPLKTISIEGDENGLLLGMMVMQLNQEAWSTVMQPNLSQNEYMFAARRAKAGCSLFDHLPKQNQAQAAGVFNTYGVAVCRAEQWDSAKAAVQISIAKIGENPMDAALLALIEHHNGDAEATQKQMEQVARLMKSDGWKHDADCHQLVHEITKSVAQPQ